MIVSTTRVLVKSPSPCNPSFLSSILVPPLFSGAPIFGAYGTSALLYAPLGVALSPDETVLYFADIMMFSI